jgi:hypothetical protein
MRLFAKALVIFARSIRDMTAELRRIADLGERAAVHFSLPPLVAIRDAATDDRPSYVGAPRTDAEIAISEWELDQQFGAPPFADKDYV